MTSFKFPPPPPPPPKPASQHAQPPLTNNRGGTGNDRGRGRNGSGFHSSSGGSRGGHAHGNPRGNARGRGGQRGGQHNCRGGGSQRQSTYSDQATHSQPIPTNQTRAYVNPAFVGAVPPQSPIQPQVDPNALAQVMSFMSTPAGVHSMAAFASHVTSTNNASTQQTNGPPSHHANTASSSVPSVHAGQKRKLNDRNKPPPQQPSTKPPRARAAVPPPVPSFGFALPVASDIRPAKAAQPTNQSDAKKRRLNLGLTKDNVAPEESSEEEDIDEEEAYARNLKGGGFVFEHEGEQISIQTGAEVAAWIKDRRKNFPTQQRVAEKAKQDAIKRRRELEFLRRIQGKPSCAVEEEDHSKPTKPARKAQNDADARHMRKQEELAALRKKLHESMAKKQSASTAVNLGLGYDSETESDGESSVLSESSVVSSSEESSDDSDSDVEPAADEEPPEAASSKVGPAEITVPPPVPMEPPPANNKKRICHNWAEHGRCSFSRKCRFAHPPKAEKVEQRVSLYERMVEQELVKADQLALDAIKYLGQNGFLG